MTQVYIYIDTGSHVPNLKMKKKTEKTKKLTTTSIRLLLKITVFRSWNINSVDSSIKSEVPFWVSASRPVILISFE